MLSAYALVVASLIGAGATSSSHQSVTTAHTVNVQSGAATVATFTAEDDFTITSARWITHTIGVGLGSETVSLVVDGVTACSLTVACLGAAGTEVAGTCNVRVTAGQDVDWTRSGCVTPALGAITYQVVQ